MSSLVFLKNTAPIIKKPYIKSEVYLIVFLANFELKNSVNNVLKQIKRIATPIILIKMSVIVSNKKSPLILMLIKYHNPCVVFGALDVVF